MSTHIKDLLKMSASQLGIDLSVEKLEDFSVFADELKKWNRKINLTAITDDSEIAVKHFADSLSLLKVVRGDGALLDIGSGAGFPSIPLKIALPQLAVVSVDSAERKILFQRHLGRVLALDGFFPVHARCEDLEFRYGKNFDWIVSRALSELAAFAKLALPLLRTGGRMIAMKGRRGSEEASAQGPELAEAGVSISDIVEINLPVTGDTRCLVVMKKSEEEISERYSK